MEAVTGAGKTAVALNAVQSEYREGGKSLIVVPTVDLLHQWFNALRKVVPYARVGRLGEGHEDCFRRSDILIATVQSARTRRLFPGRGLLVGDECHRYGSDVNRQVLSEAFSRRLGLSATLERTDGAHESVIAPYFGGVVFRLGLDDALAEHVVARYKVATVAVSFEPDERAHYDYLSEKLRMARARLIDVFAVPSEPFGAFMKGVSRLSQSTLKHEAIAAGRYLSLFSQRRALLAATRAKLEMLVALEPAIRRSQRAMVFTQTVAAAKQAADELVDLGLDADALHSGLARDERRELLARFARGALHTIVAPQVLDEGIDVPDTDFGIILAASRQRRQMVQRMGRVLRLKPDGRAARFAILYVHETSEDPGHGALGTWLDTVTENADAVRNFTTNCNAREVCDYLYQCA